MIKTEDFLKDVNVKELAKKLDLSELKDNPANLVLLCKHTRELADKYPVLPIIDNNGRYYFGQYNYLMSVAEYKTELENDLVFTSGSLNSMNEHLERLDKPVNMQKYRQIEKEYRRQKEALDEIKDLFFNDYVFVEGLENRITSNQALVQECVIDHFMSDNLGFIDNYNKQALLEEIRKEAVIKNSAMFAMKPYGSEVLIDKELIRAEINYTNKEGEKRSSYRIKLPDEEKFSSITIPSSCVKKEDNYLKVFIPDNMHFKVSQLVSKGKFEEVGTVNSFELKDKFSKMDQDISKEILNKKIETIAKSDLSASEKQPSTSKHEANIDPLKRPKLRMKM